MLHFRHVIQIPHDTPDFQSLIRWLATTQHGGKYYPMSKRLGFPTALIPQWASGKVTSPTSRHIWKLCETDDLSHEEVEALVAKRKRRTIPPEVVDLKSFVRWLAREYHHGKYHPMVDRVGVTTALVYQWRDGVVNLPNTGNLKKLCGAYGYNTSEVLRRIWKRR